MDPLEAAKDQALFREVNERLRDLNEALEELARESVFICECANRDCMTKLTVTLGQYEDIRRVPTHFLVAPDSRHVFGELERVVDQTWSHYVVEKFGEAGVAAVKLDPRSRQRRVETAAYAATRPEREPPHA